MGYRTEVAVILGDMDVTRVTVLIVRGTLSLHTVMGRTPPVSGGHQLLRDSSGSTRGPLDDIHRARIDEGVGDIGQSLERI